MFRRLLKKVSLVSVFCLCGCGTVAENREGINATPLPTIRKSDAVEKLEYVEQGNFEYVITFRRRDGGELNSEDRKFLREKCSERVNQWVVTDDKKMAIAGTNFRIEPKNLADLRKRFLVEDVSKNQNEDIQSDKNSSSNKISGVANKAAKIE